MEGAVRSTITKLYRVLEDRFPSRLKRLVPQRWRVWVGYQIKVSRRSSGQASLPGLVHPLILPVGETEQSLRDFLARFYIKEDGLGEERNYYLDEAFKRFLYTLQIVPRKPGNLLEIGANPYFMSLLLKHFTLYDLTFANFFGDHCQRRAAQTLMDLDGSEILIEFDHINVEVETLPYATGFFDVVLLCEVLEHFTKDPCRALSEIKRVLKPQGTLILTTPNVARLENVVRLFSGDNIYDVYSRHGPYGRHNREYTTNEIKLLLDHLGFTIEQMFTSDVHPHAAGISLPRPLIKSLGQQRGNDLGQYIFVRAINVNMPKKNKPRWLYRSYPSEELA